MSRTLQKVVAAGKQNPNTVPTKIYIDKGKGNIVALESVSEIGKRYKDALASQGQDPLVQFTDYRGNPSAVHVNLIKGYTALCSETEYVAALTGAQAPPLKVQNVHITLPEGAESELLEMFNQLSKSMKAKELTQ